MRGVDLDRITLWLQTVTAILVVVALIIGTLYLAEVNRQTRDTLRLLSCIVLVDQPQRTTDTVSECLGRDLMPN